MRYSCPVDRDFQSECSCTHIRRERPSLEVDGGFKLLSREEPPLETARRLNASPPGFASCLLKRMAFDAGSEVGRFFLVVCIGSGLASRCSLFKRDAVLLDEGHEFVRGRSVDVIDVLGRLIVDFPRTERPLHLHLGASVLGDRVRNRHHAAERRFFHFGHIVLHDQRIANRFYIDGHWPAVSGGGGASGDMRMGAALILSIREA